MAAKRHRHPPISELPFDVISIILLYLPVTSLLKFKSVSTCWFSLISSPDFTNKHLTITKAGPGPRRIALSFAGNFFDHCCLSRLLLVPRLDPQVKEYQDISNYPPQHGKRFRVVGSSDGVICLYSGYNERGCLVLWNPSIRKIRPIPHFGVEDSRRKMNFGFGFDNASNDYKVVGFFNDNNCSNNIVKVFSFRNNRWDMIKPPDFPRLTMVTYPDEPTAFANGVGKFYWVRHGLSRNNLDAWSVCYLELHTEVYRAIQIPEVITEYPRNYRLALSEHNLLHALCQREGKGIIWTMKEDDHNKVSWTKLCTIDFVDQRPRKNFWVLNSGEIMVILGASFLIYNPKDGSQRLSEIRTPVTLAACTFVQSLVWP